MQRIEAQLPVPDLATASATVAAGCTVIAGRYPTFVAWPRAGTLCLERGLTRQLRDPGRIAADGGKVERLGPPRRRGRAGDRTAAAASSQTLISRSGAVRRRRGLTVEPCGTPATTIATTLTGCRERETGLQAPAADAGGNGVGGPASVHGTGRSAFSSRRYCGSQLERVRSAPVRLPNAFVNRWWGGVFRMAEGTVKWCTMRRVSASSARRGSRTCPCITATSPVTLQVAPQGNKGHVRGPRGRKGRRQRSRRRLVVRSLDARGRFGGHGRRTSKEPTRKGVRHRRVKEEKNRDGGRDHRGPPQPDVPAQARQRRRGRRVHRGTDEAVPD